METLAPFAGQSVTMMCSDFSVGAPLATLFTVGEHKNHLFPF